MEARLRSISPATTAGSTSTGSGAPPPNRQAGLSSVLVGMKPSRSSTDRSASPMRGSDRPSVSSRPARAVGEPSTGATSTNSRPPASAMGRGVVSCHSDSPRGFIGSVIIC